MWLDLTSLETKVYEDLHVINEVGSYPLPLFKEELSSAIVAGIPITCHAGEWPQTQASLQVAGKNSLSFLILHSWVRCQENWTRLDITRLPWFSPTRCGTKYRRWVVRGSELWYLLHYSPIYSVGWKTVSWDGHHPIKDMFRAGTRVSLSSDNMLMGGTRDR